MSKTECWELVKGVLLLLGCWAILGTVLWATCDMKRSAREAYRERMDAVPECRDVDRGTEIGGQ